MGNFKAVWKAASEDFQFRGNRATVRTPDSEVQSVIDHFKRWVPRATQVYRQLRQRQRQQAADQERARLRVEREELKRQHRLRETIRL